MKMPSINAPLQNLIFLIKSFYKITLEKSSTDGKSSPFFCLFEKTNCRPSAKLSSDTHTTHTCLLTSTGIMWCVNLCTAGSRHLSWLSYLLGENGTRCLEYFWSRKVIYHVPSEQALQSPNMKI